MLASTDCMKSSKPSPSSLIATAISLGPDRVDVVSIAGGKGEMLSVSRVESFPIQGGLPNTLKRLRQGGALRGSCRLLLSPGEYQPIFTEAPPLPESAPQDELREAVRWKIKDQLNFPATAASIDVQPFPLQPGRPAQVLAAAADHAALRPLIEAFQSARIELAGITIPEIAQRNIARLYETPDRALALLVCGQNDSLLTVSCNGTLYATRRLDVNAADLARDKSLYDRALLEVQRSLDNFERNFGHLSLQRLLVLPIPKGEDFVEHLSANLYQPVEALNMRGALKLGPLLANPGTLADALPAIGAALGSGPARDINLYDPALRAPSDPWTIRNLGLGLAAALTVCALPAGWAQWRQADAARQVAALDPQLQAAREEVKALSAQISGHKPDAGLLRELEMADQRLSANKAVLDYLKKTQAPEHGEPGDWLRAFARRIPNGLWLTGFSVEAETGAVNLRGRTVDPRLIPDYVRRLKAEPAFEGRTFAALQIVDSGAPQAASASASASAEAQGPSRYHEFGLTSSAKNGGQP